MDLVKAELKRASVRVTVTLTPSTTITPHEHNVESAPASQQASNTVQMQAQSQNQLQADQHQQHAESTQTQTQRRQASEKLVVVELLSDNYLDVMTRTVHEVSSDLKLCRQLLQQGTESFSSLVSFYGENAQAFATDAVFWGDITAFVNRFTACQKQVRKQLQASTSRMHAPTVIMTFTQVHSPQHHAPVWKSMQLCAERIIPSRACAGSCAK